MNLSLCPFKSDFGDNLPENSDSKPDFGDSSPENGDSLPEKSDNKPDFGDSLNKKIIKYQYDRLSLITIFKQIQNIKQQHGRQASLLLLLS
ncbi:MAG: hypothetical protein KKD05_06260 [Candidatus Omnitrophica bacterium]|nr:hypothetical protein [Candidatus Omnitrophota bacterium]